MDIYLSRMLMHITVITKHYEDSSDRLGTIKNFLALGSGLDKGLLCKSIKQERQMPDKGFHLVL